MPIITFFLPLFDSINADNMLKEALKKLLRYTWQFLATQGSQ
jgi:hypothetical protein